MKKNLLFTCLLTLAAPICMAGTASNTPMMKAASVTKAPSIYSKTVITTAPEGEVVNGIRDSYSTFYKDGNHNRGYENGVLGEYVMGKDGNVYLRGVCYTATKISTKTDTYLKLEKVNDTTYVAHTPQLIWVDTTDGDTPFSAYATRTVFVKKSSSSFSYEIEEDENGYHTDVYFTLKDGNLKQTNQNKKEMNGEYFPEELIGFTSAAGNWIGFGGGNITITKATETATTLPADAKVEEKTLCFDILHVRDIAIDNAVKIKYARVGNEIYISNPSAGTDQWIKGTIDTATNTVTFLPQYLGLDTSNGYSVWFSPATFDKYGNLLNDETDTRDWFRNYTAAEKFVFKIVDDKLIPAQENMALYFSHSSSEMLETGVFANPSITFYKNESQTPAPVVVTKFEPYDDMWGFGVVGFGIPCRSEDGSYINPDELYFNFYADDSTTPFVFSEDDYLDMTGSMTDVPYAYKEDFDFKVNGVNHTVYFYKEWKKVGIQVVQVRDGVTTRSKIVYAQAAGSDNDSAVKDFETAPAENGVRKYVKEGEIRIVRNGVEYNVLGTPVK